MKQLLIILIIIASSCNVLSPTARTVELVKKEKALMDMNVRYRLIFKDGSVRYVSLSMGDRYEVGRCYLIR